MEIKGDDLKIILGAKLRQIRYSKDLSLKQLAEKSDLSISYMSEIESGKKYPKPDKMIKIARALGLSYDALVNLQTSDSETPAMNFLKSPIFHEFPFKLFGITLTDVIDLVKDSPEQAAALVRTLTEIGEMYDMKVEQFFFAALRSYQKLHSNYFEDLEQAAIDFMADHAMKIGPADYDQLRRVLETQHGYEIDEQTIDKEPDLAHFRSVWVDGNPPKLLINGHLSESQKAFICGHALAYEHLKLSDRPTTSSWLRVESFEQVLNNFRASYFAGALLIPRDLLVADLAAFLAEKRWNPNSMRSLMRRYKATPEMFSYRLTQLIPKYFGLEEIYFLRFSHHRKSAVFELTKEFNFSRFFIPHGMGLSEHYCRRWLSIKLLKKMADEKVKQKDVLIDAQRSHFIDSEAEFLTISMTRPLLLSEDTNSCVTVGFLLSDEFKKKVGFWEDERIGVVEVNETCERCRLTDCHERAVPGTLFENERRQAQKEQALERVLARIGASA